MTFRRETHEWLGRVLGPTGQPFTLARMKGATSSSVFLVEPSQNFPVPRFVLRVLDDRTWLDKEPDLAAHEAAALREAHTAGLAAPELVAYAPNDVGFGAPVVLMSFLAGSVDLRPASVSHWLGGLAHGLAATHEHTANAFPWRYQSWLDRETLAPPTWTTVPRLWERAIALALGPEPDDPLVFLHRDYHPTNVLWHAGAVSGVVDWINACRGPAGVDVAHCRTNLALMSGPETADRFLRFYEDARDGYSHNAYWDIVSLLDMALPRPGFYWPWQEFGLPVIAPETLQRRAEAHLLNVVRRF